MRLEVAHLFHHLKQISGLVSATYADVQSPAATTVLVTGTGSGWAGSLQSEHRTCGGLSVMAVEALGSRRNRPLRVLLRRLSSSFQGELCSPPWGKDLENVVQT